MPTRGAVAEFVRILPNVVSTPASEQNSDLPVEKRGMGVSPMRFPVIHGRDARATGHFQQAALNSAESGLREWQQAKV